MPDMRDVIIKALQSYSNPDGSPNMLIMALAPGLVEHLVATLPLIQLWAVGVDINGKLDEIEPDTETEVRDDALRELAGLQENLRQLHVKNGPPSIEISYGLYTSFGIDWIPDSEPDIEEDLLQLVLNDEDDGVEEPEHDWQPTGFH
jgi:hypothetical protein